MKNNEEYIRDFKKFYKLTDEDIKECEDFFDLSKSTEDILLERIEK